MIRRRLWRFVARDKVPFSVSVASIPCGAGERPAAVFRAPAAVPIPTQRASFGVSFASSPEGALTNQPRATRSAVLVIDCITTTREATQLKGNTDLRAVHSCVAHSTTATAIILTRSVSEDSGGGPCPSAGAPSLTLRVSMARGPPDREPLKIKRCQELLGGLHEVNRIHTEAGKFRREIQTEAIFRLRIKAKAPAQTAAMEAEIIDEGSGTEANVIERVLRDPSPRVP